MRRRGVGNVDAIGEEIRIVGVVLWWARFLEHGQAVTAAEAELAHWEKAFAAMRRR